MDNSIQYHGTGKWEILCHKPENASLTIQASGHLEITKDHHIIYLKLKSGDRKTIVSIPNPNIARVHDIEHVIVN